MADSDWQVLGRVQLEANWILFPPIESEIFRITHVPVEGSQDEYLKGSIALGIEENGIFNPYQPSLLTYREDTRIISLESFPKELGQSRLGIIRLDESSVKWDVLIEAFPLANAQDNLVDRIVKKLMSYFNLTDQNGLDDCGDNTQLVPRQTNITCAKGVPVLIAAGNNKRRSLTIKNYGDKPLVLGRSANVDPVEGTITDVTQRFESIPARKGFPFPTHEGCIYKGDVYALPRFNGEIEVVEWVKELMIEPESSDE